ncbi:MAG: hypothetical protein Q9208_001627 [Pyrenodesmia sp. 3 TL-2023]
MAGWEVRGYVQDSEEEEESLSDKSESQQCTGINAGLAEHCDAQVEPQGEVKDSVGAEEHPLTISTVGQEDASSITHGEAAKKGLGTIWDLPSSSQETDELQEGHYHPQPKAQSDLRSGDRTLARNSSQRDTSPTQLPTSSPLTLPTSSPTSHLSLLNSQTSLGINKHNAPLREPEVRPREEPTEQEQPSTSTSLTGITGQRSRPLRHRNPIQLHPYAIESEKYRQTLKGSGVKPLRIAQVGSQEARALQDDTQEGDFLPGAYSQDGLPRSDSPLSRSSMAPSVLSPLSRSPPLFEESDLDGDGGDLPDLEAILRHMPPKVAFNGHKRRRVMSSDVENRLQQDLLRNGQKRPQFRRPPTFGNNGQDIFEVPPSPPQSRTPTSSSASRPNSRGFRIPRRLSPLGLPTPVTSSEPRRRATMASEASPSEAHSSANESGDGEMEASASETQEVTHRQLERAQRKIRGVLPASWLKLDLKTQIKKPSERLLRHGTSSPERDAVSQRGVARPLPSRKTDSTASHIPIQLVGSSSESGRENEDTIPYRSPSPDSIAPRSPAISINSDDDDDLPLPRGLWAEVAEDNRIDAMLPPTSRGKGFRKLPQRSKHRKRQTRLTDVRMIKGKVSVQELPKHHQSRNRHQQNISQCASRPRKPKFRPPDLSLLDVSSVDVSSAEHAPPFIRVAQRTSRSRRDQGKARPDCKYLRMSTELETEEVNEYLRFWREGTLKPLARPRQLGITAPKGTRSPLRSCSGNAGAVHDSTSNPGKGPFHPTPHVQKTRPRSRMPNWPKARSIQTTLSNIVHLARNDHELGISRELKRDLIPGGNNRPLRRPSRSGQVVSSFQASAQSRPAMLESLQANADHRGRSSLRHRLEKTDSVAVEPNPLLAKFLGDTGPSYTTMHSPEGVLPDDTIVTQVVANLRKPQPRKRRPRQLPIQIPRSHHATDPLRTNHDDLHWTAQSNIPARDFNALTGLAPSGTPYSISFDLVPLPTGTCFSERTFIGSGEFKKSFVRGDLDQVRGFHLFDYDSVPFRWGPWDDNVCTQLGRLIDDAYKALETSPRQTHLITHSRLEGTIELLRQLVRYLSKYLSFHDTVDRIAFLQRCKNLVLPLFQLLSVDRSEEAHYSVQAGKPLRMRAISLCSVLLAQLVQISKHAIVPHAMQTDIRSCLQDMIGNAFEHALNDDSAGIAQCVVRLKPTSGSSVVLDENFASVEFLVIACHVLEEDASLTGFWRAMQRSLLPTSAEARTDVRVLEACWERLYLVLPFLAFDQQGVLDARRRQINSAENWAAVKSLLEPVFEAYDANTHTRSPTINSYCRAVFGRCFELINVWGWRRCESIIGVLFDFFARRSLFHLPNEESRGSPSFLSQLNQKPLLRVAPEDRCFHILLKIVGTGLWQMQQVYPNKKIRDIVWRLMPNHGRFLPKDQAIQRTDLDALRNHHDLLCTLYWGSPPGFRPRPTVIRNLVDVENSHKEACRINIRAWSNLMTFQLTVVEPLTDLKPFIDWWNILLEQIVRQHQNARIEAEEHAGLAESREGVIVNRSLLDATVAQNQRHVEAVLSEVLLSMKNAISTAPDLEAAILLLSPDLPLVFNLFSARSPHTNQVVIHALEVLFTFCNKAMSSAQTQVAPDNDDSQDYGDWSAFEPDAIPASLNPAVAQHLEGCIQSPLRQLLSNCFGADTCPEDEILTKVVDTWVAVGRVMLQEGRRAVTDYIGGYGPDSWAALRDTEQTRRFTTYYLAVLVESDGKVFEEHPQIVLKAWAASVVERELLLKYQHRLTSSLLNAGADKSILANPPFWSVDGRFQITSSEFSERRLSLISNMLSNMRKSAEHGQSEPASGAAQLKADYKEILRVMMSLMKSNYQQLGQGLDIHGAYVDFVHKVVEVLQQHTSSICPIDRFFTDSSSFALPATDPTYVVGQLKNYGMRLHDHRTPKQLAVFIQSVSERAALDGQQMYLVDQLFLAMKTNTHQAGLEDSGLRSFLITVVFPTYIDSAFNTACGWILALPILQALKSVFSSIVLDINGVNDACVESTSTMILRILVDLQTPLESLMEYSDTMKQPKTLKVLSACFAAITAVLPALDYLCLLSRQKVHDARALMNFFRSFGLFAAQSLLGETNNTEAPDFEEVEHTTKPVLSQQHVDVQAFALQGLRETLTKHWICHDEHYYVNRGMSRRRVMVDLGFFEEEKAAFLGAFEGFWNALERMTVLRLE